MIRYGLSVLCLLAGAIVVYGEEKAEHTTDSLETIKQNLGEEKALLIDVRETKEWESGHLDVAKLVPLSKLKELGNAKAVDGIAKDKILYLHCRSGRRVLQASEYFSEMGYDVRPLKWGYDALLDAGFEKSK